jgi:hypothetical protein
VVTIKKFSTVYFLLAPLFSLGLLLLVSDLIKECVTRGGARQKVNRTRYHSDYLFHPLPPAERVERNLCVLENNLFITFSVRLRFTSVSLCSHFNDTLRFEAA